MPCLTQKKSDGSLVKQWNLGKLPLTVGRGDDVNAKVDDGELSRRHFTIEPTEKGYAIRDLGSLNGTQVNGQKITGTVILKPGARIRAGQSNFVFEEGLSTIIGQLEKDPKGYSTQIRELSKQAKK